MRRYLLFINLIALMSVSAQNSGNHKFDKDLILYLPLNGDLKDKSPLKNESASLNIKPEKDKDNNKNGAFSFESNGSISIKNVENFNRLTSFTLSSWVYVNRYYEHNNIFSKVTPNRDFNLQVMGDGTLDFHFAYGSYTHIMSQNKVPLRNWTHVLLSYKDQVFKMYINGKQEELNIYVADQKILPENLKVEFLWTGKSMTIGNLYEGSGESFRGSLDEIRIYKKALSDTEIKELYNAKNKDKAKSYPLGDFNTAATELLNKTIYDRIASPNSPVEEPVYDRVKQN